MAKRIAINGFGRIGRLVYRALLERDMLDGAVEVVAVNDLSPTESIAHLLKYDSTQGQVKNVKVVSVDTIEVNGRVLKTLAQKTTPDNLPWRDLGVDLVVESTGIFSKKQDAEGHLKAGAKKVIISAPSDADVKTIVLGVNDHTYNGEDLVSNASCTTNCLAPVAKVLNDSFGIVNGLMTTVHAYTNDQNVLDGPHKDLRRARSAAVSMIPTTTGAAKAVGIVLPELNGKLNGMAIRVPTPTGSLVDLTCNLEKEASVNEINAAIKAAAEGPMKGILEYTEDPIVSVDIIHNAHSSIFDAQSTMTIGKLVKVISWYDNEWGFSNRMAELIGKVASYV